MQDTIYERFRDAMVDKVSRMRIGDPMDPETKMGAVVSRAHRDKVLAAIATARGKGAPSCAEGGDTSHVSPGFRADSSSSPPSSKGWITRA